MGNLEVCPNCGHIFVAPETQLIRAGGRCRFCGQKGKVLEATPEEYRKMVFDKKPPADAPPFDSKTWLMLGAIILLGVAVFAMGGWIERICSVVFIFALAAFYLIERAQLEKIWKKKG